MNTHDDGEEVGDLLRRGYAADPAPGFADSLLTRLQKEVAPPRLRGRMVLWAAVAAGVAILFGAALILRPLCMTPPAPTVAEAPADNAEPVLIRGRIVQWTAPTMTLAVSDVIQGKLDAKTVVVDLSGELDAMRSRVRRQLGRDPIEAPGQAEIAVKAAMGFAALLSSASGTDVIIEIAAVPGQVQPEKAGRILYWGGVPDLPPRNWSDDREGAVIVVAEGSGSVGLAQLGDLPADEWGMPR